LIKSSIILGIDPGTTKMGYGVIQTGGERIQVLQYGILNVQSCKTLLLRLQKINYYITKILDDFLPDEVALEAPFYGKNVQTMLKLGRVQGIVMAGALRREIAITEYAPRKVKQAITGNGNAAKEQVAHMLKNMLYFTHMPQELDATDALAVAVCHACQKHQVAAQSTSWKQFIQENPTRLA